MHKLQLSTATRAFECVNMVAVLVGDLEPATSYAVAYERMPVEIKLSLLMCALMLLDNPAYHKAVISNEHQDYY